MHVVLNVTKRFVRLVYRLEISMFNNDLEIN